MRCERREFIACGSRGLIAAALALLGRSAAAAEPQWAHEWVAGNLHFHTDFSPLELQVELGAIDGLRDDLAKTLGIQISDEVIHVIVFAHSQTYHAYMRNYFPDVPQRRALFIKRRGPGMVFTHANRELAIDLRHETTHAMLNAALPYVPLWLDEGLAEYFEVDPPRRAAGSGHLKIARIAALLHQVPSLARLEAIADLAGMASKEYREAWSWVHFLLHESPASRDVLVRFLQDIQSGLPPGPLSRRIGGSLPEAEDRYVRHFRNFS